MTRSGAIEPQRRQRLPVEAEQPVRVVLDDQHVVPLAELEDLGPPARPRSVTPAGLWKFGTV